MEDNKQIYNLFLGIFNYEKFLAQIYKKPILSNIYKNKVSLIKLSDYEILKKSVCYNELLKENNYKSKFNKDDFSSLIKTDDISIEKIKKVKQINVSQEELIKLIKDGNKYKIIDENLSDLICIKNKFYTFNYTYIINSDNLIFLDLLFRHQNNILDEFSYAMCNGHEKIIYLAKSIIEFFILKMNLWIINLFKRTMIKN